MSDDDRLMLYVAGVFTGAVGMGFWVWFAVVVL